MHSETTRHYHTTVHLWEMLQYFDLLRSLQYGPAQQQEGEEVTITVLSVFFHDAVYNGKSSTNEEDSAKLFETFAEELSVSPAIKSKVADFILGTKKHRVESNGSESVLSLFLDLDMAVLGKQTTAYNHYAARIRNEYSFVEDNEYCSKRADVLDSFLQQPRIYGTAVMHQALEEQARLNLRNEIESLRKGVIPSGE